MKPFSCIPQVSLSSLKSTPVRFYVRDKLFSPTNLVNDMVESSNLLNMRTSMVIVTESHHRFLIYFVSKEIFTGFLYKLKEICFAISKLSDV